MPWFRRRGGLVGLGLVGLGREGVEFSQQLDWNQRRRQIALFEASGDGMGSQKG